MTKYADFCPVCGAKLRDHSFTLYDYHRNNDGHLVFTGNVAYIPDYTYCSRCGYKENLEVDESAAFRRY